LDIRNISQHIRKLTSLCPTGGINDLQESQRYLPNFVTADPEILLKGWKTQGLGRGHTNNGTNVDFLASAHGCQIIHSILPLTYTSPRDIPKFTGPVTSRCGEHMD
jgi:hypothetical protein